MSGWYVAAAGIFTLAVIVGVLAGRLIVGRFSPSGSPPPSAPPGGESE